MRLPSTDVPSIIGEELNLPRKSVNATIKLLDEGATVPFIARYRKEATGELDESQIRSIQLRLESLREYLKRREYVVSVIKDAGAMTPELADRIEHTLDPAVLEDIYLPFKPKRRTKAEMAREKGLEPLARQIMAQNLPQVEKAAAKYVGMSNSVADTAEATAGAMDIIAEWISENEKARNIVRSRYMRNAIICSSRNSKAEDPDGLYTNYYDFSQPLRTCASHRYLAMRRGEDAGILKVTVSIDDEEMIERLGRFFVRPGATDECASLVRSAVKDGYRRLIRPSIENEMCAAAKEKADTAAIALFADNVRQLLLAPPMFGKRVMAIDPGFRTGCKVVCLDERGHLLAHNVIYPTAPKKDIHGATYTVCSMVDEFSIDVIAVGSGTAGRETEQFLSHLRYPRQIQIVMVNEDGASVYSASDIAREEMPDQDVTVRGAVSIGRRLIDPLAELVKIDPKSIGVGQYQHDVDQNRLKEALNFTVESCVNSVGVNINTASRSLLGYVSGIGPTLAKNIVDYRTENGNFRSREELMNVPRMGEKAFQQCAGFLRIPDAGNPLDNTAIHPESYGLVTKIAEDLNTSVNGLISNPRLLESVDPENYLNKTVGLPTLHLVLEELEKPGRDPRGDVETPHFDESLMSIRDLKPGMIIGGKVNNLTAFGAFVDLGIKENGLLHISQMSDSFITSPSQVVGIGQHVKVKVLEVDTERNRIALTLKGVDQDR